MIPHLLIDNCILLNLVSKSGFSELLEKLVKIANEKKVILLVPEMLKEEWQKHRERLRRELSVDIDKLSAEARQQKVMNHPKAAYTAAQVNQLKAVLYSQFDAIDSLLANSPATITHAETPAVLIYEQQRKKKAPYTKPGKEVLSDAVIFYSSLDYCKRHGLNDLFFVTSNHTDYSFSTARKEELHPDYLEVYPEITIHYHVHIGQLFGRLEKEGIQFAEEKQNETGAESEQVDTSTIFIDRDSPILDQVYFYLKEVFEELSIIPKKFFAEQYPFILAERFVYYHQAYTLVTDNKEIYELLQVEIDGDNYHDPSGKFVHTDEDKEKIRFILQILLQNWIQQVSFKNQQSVRVNVKGHRTICTCVHCNWRGLRWSKAIAQLYPPADTDASPDSEQLLKHAFVRYRIGDFKGAAESFGKIYESQAAYGIRKYLLAFNLKKLTRLMQHEYMNESFVHQLVKKIDELDLEKILAACIRAKPAQKGLLNWMHERKFQLDTMEVLQHSVDQMRDLYYSQNGGNVEYTRESIEAFMVCDDFLNLNYIVYDKFTEYKRLTNAFVETLFASYGASKRLGGKLIHFSDYLLERLVLNADGKNIQKYASRYNVQNALYELQPANRFDLVAATATFFLEHDSLEKESSFEKGFHYNDQLTSIAINALQAIGMLSITAEELNVLAPALLSYLSTDERVDFRVLQSITSLLNQKKSLFSTAFYLEVIKLVPGIKNLHQEGLVAIATDMLEKTDDSKADVKNLDDSTFDMVLAKFTAKCPDCNSEHPWGILSDYYQLMSHEQRSKTTEVITSLLHAKFEAHDYYIASMLDMISGDNKLHRLYTDYIKEAIEKPYPRPPFFSAPEYADHRVDQYLNYCFKLGLEVPQEIDDKLRETSDYYFWLLNPESFDYSKFEDEWLDNHFTLHYKKWFKKSNKLKEYMIGKLWDSNNRTLERKVLQIYVMPLERPF